MSVIDLERVENFVRKSKKYNGLLSKLNNGLTYGSHNSPREKQRTKNSPSFHPVLAETMIHNLFDFVDENFQVVLRNVVFFLEMVSRFEHGFSFLFFIVWL